MSSAECLRPAYPRKAHNENNQSRGFETIFGIVNRTSQQHFNRFKNGRLGTGEHIFTGETKIYLLFTIIHATTVYFLPMAYKDISFCPLFPLFPPPIPATYGALLTETDGGRVYNLQRRFRGQSNMVLSQDLNEN